MDDDNEFEEKEPGEKNYSVNRTEVDLKEFGFETELECPILLLLWNFLNDLQFTYLN